MRRKNGLSAPHTAAQISAFLALVGTALQFAIVVAPALPRCSSAPITLAFAALVMCVINFGGKAVSIDPIDVHLERHLTERYGGTSHGGDEQNEAPVATAATTGSSAIGGSNAAKKLEWTDWQGRLYRYFNGHRRDQPLPVEPMKQCWICNAQVAEPSMHCKFCDKCVYHFDHHCMCTFMV
jgi:hypothetical protein